MELNFDASVVPERSFLQAGWHPAVVENAEPKTSKSNADNGYLEVTFQITEGPSQGAKAWARFNLWNVNPQAVQIANEEFAELCRSSGRARVGRSEELHGLQVMLEVVPQRDRPDRTEIKRYAPLSSKSQLMAGGAGANPTGGAAPPSSGPAAPAPPASIPAAPPQAAPPAAAPPPPSPPSLQAAPPAPAAPGPANATSTAPAPWER